VSARAARRYHRVMFTVQLAIVVTLLILLVVRP
jgi:hypothetical protein